YKGQEIKRTFSQYEDLTSTTDYHAATGQIKTITNQSSSGAEILDYKYDLWGNIQQQSLDRGSDQAIETFDYDTLHRLKKATMNENTVDESIKTYDYDVLGNIREKSDFSNSYQYGDSKVSTTESSCNRTSNPGPNAVKSASLINGSNISYHYDARGNRIADCIGNNEKASYIYDYNNLLIESTSSITDESQQTLEFNYGPDNQRYRKYDALNGELTLYANKDYEQIYKGGILTQSKYYITSYMTITKDYQTGAKRTHFMQKDRLGSTTQVLDETGDLLHTMSYDAFGKPRKGDWSDQADENGNKLFKSRLGFTDVDAFGNVISDIDISKRGFTEHEHLDEMQLIHMNGRMYDYNNGRFLSVDPFIQSPTSTQAMHPYTYILNNPLSGTDPSGYAFFLAPAVPYILQGLGWASAAWGTAETGEALGKGVAEVATGNKSLGAAVVDTGAEVGKGLIVTAAGGIVGKAAYNAIKANKVAKINGNKNNSQTSTTTQNKDNSSLEDQKSVEKNYHGETIHREPKSIQDQMTMDAAKKGEGQVKMTSDKLDDPNLTNSEKIELETISSEGKKSNVHYVRDKETGKGSDYKFVKSSTDRAGRYEKTREGGKRDNKKQREENEKQQQEEKEKS
ncbi:MAG: RHS repeat domain-containing protein, partial [Marinicellaceae bacterium]